MPKKAEISFIELEQDSLSCLMPANHELANKQSLSLDELADVPIIACNPLNAPLSTASFQQQLLEKHSADKVLYCDNIEVAHCMVSAGMGISILPNILILNSSDFASVPLAHEAPLSFGIFYHKRSKNGALSKFLKLI